METSSTQRIRSWYETPYGRLCDRAGHRRQQGSVAEVMASLVETGR